MTVGVLDYETLGTGGGIEFVIGEKEKKRRQTESIVQTMQLGSCRKLHSVVSTQKVFLARSAALSISISVTSRS